MNITIDTTNKLAKSYYKRYNDSRYVKKHRKIFEKLLKGKNKKILDVGCGHGRDIREFTKDGYQTMGIDLSDKIIEIAKKQNPGILILKQDMTKIDYDKAFDGIWSCGSFYHLKKCKALLTLIKFNKALKQNGILFLAIKEGKGEKFISRDIFKGLKKFYAFYTESEIIWLLLLSGFTVIKLQIEHKSQNWINIWAKKK